MEPCLELLAAELRTLLVFGQVRAVVPRRSDDDVREIHRAVRLLACYDLHQTFGHPRLARLAREQEHGSPACSVLTSVLALGDEMGSGRFGEVGEPQT